ncbi:MAG TPA: Stealth CR1 domain-containing protein [Ohtaekwangia sp.]
MQEHTDTIIDAVITWVDGDDPRHIAKRNQILGANDRQAQSITARLGSVNEIAYCVESIIQFAPFIRTIFIVTDEQIPDVYYAYPDRIKIIDHKVIYRGYEQALPTINIFSIECMLYRIPGLAENFMYFNDDFFLIKPTTPQDWFRNRHPVLRGRWEIPPEKTWYRRLAALVGIKRDKRASFRKTQSKAASLLGFENRYFRCYHTPRALRKSTYENFFEAHPELLLNQIQHRKRHSDQFNPYSLAWHLEIKNNTAHIASAVGIMELHNPAHKSIHQIERMLQSAERKHDVLCVNIQNLNLASADQQRIIFNWLDRIIPGGHRHRMGLNQSNDSQSAS